jgi:squalene cyclase
MKKVTMLFIGILPGLLWILNIKLLFSQEIPIEKGIIWLRNNQNIDGSWTDLPESLTTPFEITCTVADTLNYLGIRDTTYSGIGWISSQKVISAQYLARKVESLVKSEVDVTELVDLLLSYQNSDGGWGVAEGFSGDVLDTSLVLLALFSCNYSDSVVIGNGVNFILSQQNLDGSWGFEDGGEGNIYLTSLVLSVLQAYQSRLGIAYSELSKAINKGANWLLNKQNSDGSFGTSIFETSLSYSALIRTTYAPEQLQKTIEYIKNTQLDNGSWNNNAYETSLALRAIYDALHPPVVLPSDLTISSSDISFTKVNNQVIINAIIHNIGQQVAHFKIFKSIMYQEFSRLWTNFCG